MRASHRFGVVAGPGREAERGYILLTLMLFVTLLAIAAVAIAPTVAFQAKRDREEEMVHRGVQYSRAIRRYFKKFGRYPTRIEDLESSNNLRFLRKRYKDPITGEDFKLLHLGEVKISFGAGIAGANMAGVNPVGGAAGQNMQSAQNARMEGTPLSGGNAAQPGTPAQGDQKPSADDAAQAASGAKPGAQADQGTSGTSGASGGGDKLSGQVFGGGPIVGVVSASKDKSIREFNKKQHYNEWQFIYDPSTDRGGLLNTPNQPPLQGAGGNVQPGANGMPAGAPGQTGAFGQPSQPAPTPQPQQPNQSDQQQ